MLLGCRPLELLSRLRHLHPPPLAAVSAAIAIVPDFARSAVFESMIGR